MTRSAPVDFPVLDVIKDRWSPRAFDERPVEPEKLRIMFEAARWAASSFNEQPWSFIVATKADPEQFNKALSCLVEFNQSWAKLAPVLILTATKTTFDKNGKANRVCVYDLGAASAHLVLQATSLGLYAHQMAGIDIDAVRRAYSIPENHEPQTAIAVGYLGDPRDLPETLREGEYQPRSRKNVEQFVFSDQWGRSGLEGQ